MQFQCYFFKISKYSSILLRSFFFFFFFCICSFPSLPLDTRPSGRGRHLTAGARAWHETWCLPCARSSHTANIAVCRVFFISRVFSWRHTTNSWFAVCPIYCTRQTFGHTANYRFPVVTVAVLFFLLKDA